MFLILSNNVYGMIADKTIAKERGRRLKALRKFAGLKRDQLANLAGVSPASISYWENASLSELNEKGGEKVIKALQEEKGINCSVEWLLYGIGGSPFKEGNIPFQLVHTQNSTNTLNQEITLFLSNPESIVFQVTSSSMSPILEPNDIAGGVWCSPADYGHIDKICIVDIQGALQVRKIKRSVIDGCYDLSYLTFSNDSSEPFEIKGINLIKIAPIVRVWKANG